MLRYYPLWIDLCNSMVIYSCISVVFMYFHVFIIRILLFLIPAIFLSNTISMTDEEPIDQIVCFLNGIDLPGVIGCAFDDTRVTLVQRRFYSGTCTKPFWY